MAGRKTIMVETSVWNKVDKLKHDLYLRSSNDAIETAVDITSSEKYFVGIRSECNENETRYYIIESLGRTEDEAVRNLLLFEQGSIYGDLRSEDIPSAEETNINEDGFFVVECTKRLYYAVKLNHDPIICGNLLKREGYYVEEVYPSAVLFSCDITKEENGLYIADSQGDENGFYVLVKKTKTSDLYEIIDYGTSPIKLQEEIQPIEPRDIEENGEYPFNYNPHDLKIYRCTSRLMAECMGRNFRSRYDFDFSINPYHGNEKVGLRDGLRDGFYGNLHWNKNKFSSEVSPYLDTTSLGKYFAALIIDENNLDEGMGKEYRVLGIGDTANKASVSLNDCIKKEVFEKQKYEIKLLPGYKRKLIEEEGINACLFDFSTAQVFTLWDTVYSDGSRSGKVLFKTALVVECTSELYCQYILHHDNSRIMCEIVNENGTYLAKFKSVISDDEEKDTEIFDSEVDLKSQFSSISSMYEEKWSRITI